MLRDSLHQPQYVEKLEKIVRFVTKEKSLTLHDLDMIWEAQVIIYIGVGKYYLSLAKYLFIAF